MAEQITVAILDYAIKLYALLDERAEENEYHERIFTGKISDLYKEIGASTAYYSRIRKLLIDNGSIELMQRGTGSQPSQLKLHRPLEVDEIISDMPLTEEKISATMGVELIRRLELLEAWRETTGGLNIAEAFRDMERRLTRLEGQVTGKPGKS
jgi:hypothetical protein